MSQSYCVVCRFKVHPETVRVVGPFGTQDEAVECDQDGGGEFIFKMTKAGADAVGSMIERNR